VTTRRALLRSFAAGGLLVAAGAPRLSLARADTDKRFVLVLLRGGLDGLAAVPPHGDPQYRSARGALALPGPESPAGVVDLDGFFGLHPSLEPLMPMWRAGQLLPIHAAATPYRSRSHFDGQDLLEAGTDRPHTRRDGWLNRAASVLGGGPALAVGQAVPLVLRGDADVLSALPGGQRPDPGSLAERMGALYAGDPLFADALAEGLRVRGMVEDVSERGRRGRRQTVPQVAELAGALLAKSDGPQLAVLEVGGWDTHAGQGTSGGRLSNLLGGLGDGLLTLQDRLGSAWGRTTVLVVSEFGRTVAANGTGGTDHGTAGVALLAGGGVDGGRVRADWPGLRAADLHQGRDLRPTVDVRGIAAGILRDHLGLSASILCDRVFPGLDRRALMGGLVRA
jgi:uncharacterized protein (DUF1501 family)